MSYLYHGKHPEIKGDILYPLNMLRAIYPDLYDAHVKRYAGKEKILEDVIPVLNCLWNDVLHFSPVHPAEIKKAFTELGKDFEAEYFEVPAELLEPEKSIIYLNGEIPKMDPKNWLPFSPETVSQFSQLPELTKLHYKEQFEKNESPLLYAKTPHILYKGALNIKNFQIITV